MLPRSRRRLNPVHTGRQRRRLCCHAPLFVLHVGNRNMPGTRPYMTDTAVDTAVGVALDRLFESEGELPPDVHERTIAGFYARHLERVLRERRSTTAGRRNSGWSVDCEYNRLGLDPKRVPDLDVMFREVAAGLGWPPDAFTAGDTGLVVPDVVVHRRQSGIGAGNLIVCE